ncbi:MAG TPA: hypothetical protein PLU30_06635 [Verrucomicrobiae bacterium]|nr:hypothetical protein [Verrucomicrobiae bacterium]
MSSRLVVFAAACLFPWTSGWGFNPPRDTVGPVTAEIGDPGEIGTLEKPVTIPVTVRNGGATRITGKIAISVIDDWRIEGKSEVEFSVAAGEDAKAPFTVVAGRGTHAALYPVHARVSFKDEKGVDLTAHPILILSVASAAREAGMGDLPLIRVPKRGPLRFDELVASSRVIVRTNREPIVGKPVGWHGTDGESGGSFSVSDTVRGDLRRAFNMHPPYRQRWGELAVDYRLALPAERPIRLAFATAIRDHDATREGASDGVDFRVEVGQEGQFTKHFARFSATKRWEEAEVDLSAYAGREVILRFIAGPGPAHNTSCDSCFWAEPTIWVGPAAAVEDRGVREKRRESAVAGARASCSGGGGDWAWRIEGDSGPFGVAIRPGPDGISDAFIAFSDGGREIVFEGFGVKIGGTPVGGVKGLAITRVEPRFQSGVGEVSHEVVVGERVVTARVRVWQEKGALRVAFSMPGTERDVRGEPRFTELAIGAGSEIARRVYGGFGNVIQDPDPAGFSLRAGGFTLSTRHIGADYANGISLVQATDIFPDELRVEPGAKRCALVAHHDATFSLVPSSKGAFAAARAYRDIAGFRRAGGVSKLLGRMCLDQWGGDYAEAASGIERAGRYGMTHAVFVKHVWQRWGYDYRLPEIYPPAGDGEAFRAIVAACKKAGILFAPHDNYIDFYPDAEGYSYRHIVFNRDGTPQKAWLNEGRQAQSYRWLPTAFFPWMEANLGRVKENIGATSYFVDVFSAIPPVDFYDRSGRFYSKTVCQERWGAAFDRIREVLGGDAPTISEAGHDGLIGHLDAGEADHNGWSPEDAKGGWRIRAADGERVPWHDMASHGAFVLLAGGLGPRYAGKENDQVLHGYGSDDYLNMTALGGRNPMCDGPFSRRAVMTYWLLHDVCAGLARAEMLAHEFVGNDIHRQTVRFSGGGVVHANRGGGDWNIGGAILPQYGFWARSGDSEATVSRRGGVICGFARMPGSIFVDARPPVEEEKPVAAAKVLGLEDLGGGRFRLRMEWATLGPIDRRARAFVHFDDERGDGETIAFQGTVALDTASLCAPGAHPAVCSANLPARQKLPATFLVRCGLYVPGPGGARLVMAGPKDRGGRALCGRIGAAAGSKPSDVHLRWEPEVDPWFAKRQARLNTGRKIVDFGPVATNGSFRMQFDGPQWCLIPLPESDPFEVRLRLDQLGAGGSKTVKVNAVDVNGRITAEPKVRREGEELRFETTERAFEYRISLVP